MNPVGRRSLAPRMPPRHALLGILLALLPALRAQRQLLDELPADGDAYELRGAGFGTEFTAVPLPGKGSPVALTVIGKVVWFARGDRLLRLSWPHAELEVDVEAPPGLTGLCADARFVYGLAAGKVVVIDPIAGRVTRTITPAPEGGVSVLGLAGEQFVLGTPVGLFLHDKGLGPATARIAKQSGRERWLAWDGTRLWAGSTGGARVVPLPGQTGPADDWAWPWRVAADAATFVEGGLLFAAERGDKGHEGECVSGVLDLRRADWFGERLSIGCYVGTKDAPRFVVGPNPVASVEALTNELKRIAADPACRVQRGDGTRGPMPVVLEAHPGVRVAALKAAWDAATAAGFDRVQAPAQEVYALELRRTATKK